MARLDTEVTREYVSFRPPAITITTTPFSLPKSDLRIQAKKLPDLLEDFQDFMIADHLDDIFRQLLRLQHPSFPCYDNGYYWLYHQAFGMLDILAEQIEIRDLRIGHYIDEAILQLDIIKERLEDEGGHRGLIKVATGLIMRLQAISNRDTQLPVSASGGRANTG